VAARDLIAAGPVDRRGLTPRKQSPAGRFGGADIEIIGNAGS